MCPSYHGKLEIIEKNIDRVLSDKTSKDDDTRSISQLCRNV